MWGSGLSQQPSASFDFENATEETPLYTVVEKMPEPEGGLTALYEVISKNMQYPAEVRKRGIQGKVFVRFVVTAQGKVESVEVIKGLDPALDKEAVRMIKLSEEQPGWVPGQEQGERVDVQLVQPVWFKLEAEKDEHQDSSDGQQHANHLNVIYNKVEEMPKPKTHWDPFNSYLKENVRYPQKALAANIQGTVYLQYIIDKEGALKDLIVIKGLHPDIDEEALRLLRLADSTIGWLPAKIEGEAVNARVVLPIHFTYDKKKVPVFVGATHISPDDVSRLIEFEELPVKEEVDGVLVYHKPEASPWPEGGVWELEQFFKRYLEYPKEVQHDAPKGDFIIRFIISAEGIPYGEKILNGVHPAMDAEALRLIREFNLERKWTPATYKNKKVAAFVEVPVNYDFEDDRGVIKKTESYTFTYKNRKGKEEVADIYEDVEVEAIPRGGMKVFYEKMYREIQYPIMAIKQNIQGTTYIKLLIDEQGDVVFAQPVEDKRIGGGLDEEAARVVLLSKWEPARHQGQYVKQMRIIPINFRLQP
ncbi:TonB family protein [Flammeovirgaceae bacterium 311]|nr:TonB family protein [Flammeovirgaceae bacterium 311]